MVIREIVKNGSEILRKNNIETPQLDAAVLLCYVLGQNNRSYLIMNYAMEVSEADAKRYLELIGKRAEGMPVAYITGKKEFMSLEFDVNEKVLIPRADTETLCECVIEKNRVKEPKIADICCGSGCIGISLAFYIYNAAVDMFDISDDAVSCANKNASKLRVDKRCGAEWLNIMNEVPYGKYDIVVSNPPYIETDVIPTLERNVAGYEPHIALDGGVDGLDFYRRLAQIVPGILNDGGIVAFEVGHTQADAVADMLKDDFCDIEAVCDLAGIKRVVFARKKIKRGK